METVYLSDRKVAERYSASRATIWRWVSRRGFPNPVRFSPGCTRWRLADIERWESQNIGTPRPAA